MATVGNAIFVLNSARAIVGLTQSSINGLQNVSPTWRPPQWGQAALTTLTVPPTAQQTSAAAAKSPQQQAQPTVYVFDAILRAEHSQELRKTEHPVQSGANIVDHAYLMPAQITLEIGMSDAMQSYTSTNWSGGASKSISAYQTLLTLQAARSLMTLTTRLNTYNNMLIESIHSSDTNTTRHGLRAVVVFSQILLATATAVQSSITYGVAPAPAATLAQSARPQATNSTTVGTAQPHTVSSSLKSQFSIASVLFSQAAIHTPGAGSWSSNKITNPF